MFYYKEQVAYRDVSYNLRALSEKPFIVITGECRTLYV